MEDLTRGLGPSKDFVLGFMSRRWMTNWTAAVRMTCACSDANRLPRTSLQFVVRDGAAGREVAGVDWEFNAWGGLYDDFSLDKLVASSICNVSLKKTVWQDLLILMGSVESAWLRRERVWIAQSRVRSSIHDGPRRAKASL